ncbi:MAG: hypothetical protein IV100_27600 [Myxococcales bacterium]|nr:hypothetical protein [Myxococcales bacterium]
MRAFPSSVRRHRISIGLAAALSLALAACAEAPESEGTSAVTCTAASDCLGLLPDDADLCSWEVSCLPARGTSGTCLVVRQSRQCTAEACQTASCDPATGACVSSPVADGLACSDGEICTTGDRCFGGACTPGPSPCGAAPCQVASCDAATGECSLSLASDFTDCSDDDACTTDDTCISGTCRGAAVQCKDDGDPCTEAACAGGDCTTSAVADALAVPCDDGVPCTTGARCAGGVCTQGVPTCVAPLGGCQVAFCNAEGDCELSDAPDGTACVGPDPCTKGQVCESGTCTGGVPKCTEHPSPCIETTCDPGDGGCLNSALSGPCDDGNVCTTDDACGAGLCRGQPVVCPSDDPPCAPVLCDGFTGSCVPEIVATGTPCDDGMPCTVLDRCSGGECTGPPACPDDGSSCTVESCDGLTAACSSVTLPDDADCDDGDPCTGLGSCVEGQCAKGPVAPCPDDGSACTFETCAAAAGGCLSVPVPDGAGCDDGDACTVGESCSGGTCDGGSARLCPGDSAACRVGVCDAATGCSLAAADDGDACDDGEPCTTSDACAAGECGGVPATCPSPGPCATVACVPGVGCVVSPRALEAACDDGDACTSGERCLNGTGPGGRDCIPVETVTCPATGLACVDSACDPAAGVCVTQPATTGRPCDDGSPCTSADACDGGECLGTPRVCPPGAPCDEVACDPSSGTCITTPKPEGGLCDDGAPCRIAGRCNAGVCSSSETVCASDGDPCTVERCDVTTGLCGATPAPEATPCDDGDPCTTTSSCTAGACAGEPDTACPPDGDVCTADACVPGLGCAYLPAPTGPCDDGSVCTTGDVCTGLGPGCVGTPVTCPPGLASCERAACDPVLGCTVVTDVDGAFCDDGNPCSMDDRCTSGACVGAPLACDPTTATCRVAICDAATGACTVAPSDVGSPCDDGKACTTTQACNEDGDCEGVPVICAPDGVCRVGVCLEPSGQCTTGPAPNGSACDDGLPCQIEDRCLLGHCSPGVRPACTPSAPCRTVACDPTSGSCSESVSADGVACTDDDLCTDSDQCVSATCIGAPVLCDDGLACTLDLCDAASGCVHADLDGEPCDDGDACTVDTRCQDGACTGAPRCLASGPCRVPACANDGTCSEVTAEDGSACDDGDTCTGDGTCSAGGCVASPIVCPYPGADCLVATCLPLVGCVASAAADGVPCADDPCATGTLCDGGLCAGGTPLACPSGGPCQIATCTAESGCRVDPAPGSPECDDGDACTDDDRCTSGACTGDTIACPAPPRCHLSVCTPAGGCTTVPQLDGAACDDGDGCTLDDICAAGACQAGSPKVCAGSVCTPESCDPATGTCQASPSPNGTPCDDGDPCSATSACLSGQCAMASSVQCPGTGDPCRVPACTPGVGCTVVGAPAGTPCNDDSACTEADACDGGLCVGVSAVVCPSATGCLASVCSPESGLCQPVLRSPGAPCDDGDTCLAGERCDDAGSCIGGQDRCCDDPLVCSDETCPGGVCSGIDERLVVLGADGVVEILGPGFAAIDDAIPIAGVADIAASRAKLVTVALPAPGSPLATVTMRDALGSSMWGTAPLPLAGGEPAFLGDDVVVLATDGVLHRFAGLSGEVLGSVVLDRPSRGRPIAGIRSPRVFIPTASGTLMVVHAALDGELTFIDVAHGAALSGGGLDVSSDVLLLIGPTSLRYARASDGDALGHRPLTVDAIADAPLAGVVVATSSAQLLSVDSMTAPAQVLATLPTRARALVHLTDAIVVLGTDALRRYAGGTTLVAERTGDWRRLMRFDFVFSP